MENEVIECFQIITDRISIEKNVDVQGGVYLLPKSKYINEENVIEFMEENAQTCNIK